MEHLGRVWPRSRSRSLDDPEPRTAGQMKKTVGKVFSQDWVQQRLVKQAMEVRKGVEQFFELLEPQMVEQLVEIVVGPQFLAQRERDTTDAAATTVEVPFGEARPPGISQHSTATESKFEGSSGEAGSSWPGAGNTARPDATVAKVVGEVRPPECAKDSATTESSFAVSSGEAGHSWPRSSAAATADAMLAGEARPHGVAKQSATTKPEPGRSWAFLPQSKWHEQCRRYSSRKVCW